MVVVTFLLVLTSAVFASVRSVTIDLVCSDIEDQRDFYHFDIDKLEEVTNFVFYTNRDTTTYKSNAICSFTFATGSTAATVVLTVEQFHVEYSQDCHLDSICWQGFYFCGDTIFSGPYTTYVPRHNTYTLSFKSDGMTNYYGAVLTLTVTKQVDPSSIAGYSLDYDDENSYYDTCLHDQNPKNDRTSYSVRSLNFTDNNNYTYNNHNNNNNYTYNSHNHNNTFNDNNHHHYHHNNTYNDNNHHHHHNNNNSYNNDNSTNAQSLNYDWARDDRNISCQNGFSRKYFLLDSSGFPSAKAPSNNNQYLFKTPNYGNGNYSSDTDCAVTFYAGSQRKLMGLHFRGFSIEMSQNCIFDWLCVRGVHLCGDWLKDQTLVYYIEAYSSITIQFVSDDFSERYGTEFMITFEDTNYHPKHFTEITGGDGSDPLDVKISVNHKLFADQCSGTTNPDYLPPGYDRRVN